MDSHHGASCLCEPRLHLRACLNKAAFAHALMAPRAGFAQHSVSVTHVCVRAASVGDLTGGVRAGKTWHTWQVDLGHQLPLGPPQLMMAFTQDGQIDPQVVKSRDDDIGCSADDTARARKNLKPEPGVPHPKADQCWHEGKAMQCVMEERPFKRGPETTFKTAQ